MKIAILGAIKKKESYRLKEEAEKRGHKVDLVDYKQFSMKLQPKLIIEIKNKDMAQRYDVLIPRGMTIHTEEALILSNYMAYKNKLVIDRKLAHNQFFIGKHQKCYNFAKKNILQPKTWYFLNNKQISKLKILTYPLIAKHKLGRKSENIYMIKNFKKAEEFFLKNNLENYLIQEFIPTFSYIRVFVVGDEVLGAMEREKKNKIPEPGQKTNPGTKSHQIPLNKQLIEISLNGTKAEKNDICGVDIIKYKNKYYLIEANRSPMFKSFEKITQINVAKKIIKFIESSYKKL